MTSPLPTPRSQPTDRSRAVTSVLYRVLFLNLIVAAAKIALGLTTGAVSVLSDGYHSLTDTASNVVGIIGVRIAGAPPDRDHPYGHRKFETMASVGILIFLLLVLREVLSAAWERLQTGGELERRRAHVPRHGRHVPRQPGGRVLREARGQATATAKCCSPTPITRRAIL